MTEIPHNGRILEGRYQLVRQLKKGGMGDVYTAKDRFTRDFVIVKKTRAEEARLLSRLKHPGIVKYLDSFSCLEDISGGKQPGTDIWLVEEYVPGETLSAYVKRNGPFDEAAVIEIGIKLCEILIFLHGRKPPVIYRDLKPDNIMLQPDGSIKLIDFGIAREYVKWEDRDTNFFGTKGYAAPEQYGGCMSQSDARSDIYGLGMVMYYLLTGDEPEDHIFSSENALDRNTLRNAVSPDFQRLLLKCTEEEPLKRFQSAEVLAYELKNIKKQIIFAGPHVAQKSSRDKREERMPETKYKNKQGLKSVLLVLLTISACSTGILLEFILLYWLLT